MNIFSPDSQERLDASRRRFRERQTQVRSLDEYSQALLIHVNEVAVALRPMGDPPRGRVFRIGLAFVSEDGLVVPVPFQRARPGSLFIDQFHVMPLRATSLGPLLERRRGDRIDDLAAHLEQRGVSLSTQVALREGVRSNVRLPWFSLDRRGILWFSADTPRFFDDRLFAYLESLVPEVELQLRLLDMLEPLLPALGEWPLPLERSAPGLQRLRQLLDVEENPLPGRVALEWHPPRDEGARLINLWRVGQDRVLLCALECEGESEAALRLLLTLRGWLLQQAAAARHPARVLEAVELRLREARREGALPQPAVVRSLGLALVHPDPQGGRGHADLVCAGEGRLWLEQDGQARRIPADGLPLGEAQGRHATVETLAPGLALLAEQGGRPSNTLRPEQLRLRLALKA
ncbi:MAG: hypothetical protein WC326_09715 [Candidatus Delongbacteria bacterium]